MIWGCSNTQLAASTLPNSFLSSSVRQLIKSQRVQNKLGIVFEKEKDKTQRKDFVFVSARVGNAQLEVGGGQGVPCRDGAGFNPWALVGLRDRRWVPVPDGWVKSLGRSPCPEGASFG